MIFEIALIFFLECPVLWMNTATQGMVLKSWVCMQATRLGVGLESVTQFTPDIAMIWRLYSSAEDRVELDTSNMSRLTAPEERCPTAIHLRIRCTPSLGGTSL